MKRLVPDIFEFSLILLDDEFTKSPMNRPFSKTPVSTIIVAARTEFDPTEAGTEVPANRKLFTEVYFTDHATADKLRGLSSLVGSQDPHSAMNLETDVIPGISLADAVRASVADPLLILPAKIRGNRYLTGAVNIDPVNVARELADEVIARYPVPYDPIVEQPALMSTFSFDGNQVRKGVLNSKVTYWVDSTAGDAPMMTPGPKFKLTLNPARTLGFGSSVPETYDEYQKVFDAQYDFAYRRTLEAFKQDKFSKGHIREPYHQEK